MEELDVEESRLFFGLSWSLASDVGDLFITSDGLFEVYEIKKEMMKNSYEMRVENGSVLANDILVSTLYLERNKINKHPHKLIKSLENEVINLN